MAKTITLNGVKDARVNLSVNPLDGDLSLTVSFSLVDSNGTVFQSKSVDATAKLTAAQKTAIANVAASILAAVKTDEGV